MKKSILMILGILIMCLTSCESTKMESYEEEGIEGNKILLVGNASTGYSWSYKESVSGIISIDCTSKSFGQGDVVGAASLYTYTVSAKKDGKVTLTFTYSRPWEDVKPLRKEKYLVVVKDSSVTITKK